MAVITGTVKGCLSLKDDADSGDSKLAYVTFTMPAFGGADTGTLPVAAAITASRRNGKTVTLRSACRGEAGLAGGVKFYTTTEAVSGTSITYLMTNQTGAQIAGAAGVGGGATDRAMSLVVAYDEA